MSKLADARLLTVADDLSAIGGSEIAQLRVVGGLSSAGWDVELLYRHGGDLWPQWSAVASHTRTVRALRIQPADPFRSGFGTAGALAAMGRSQAQVLYLHNPGDLAVALVASRAKRIPVALHLHLPPPIRQPRWLNRLIRMTDGVVTPSGDAASRWMRVAGLTADQVSVIPTGVDTDHFVPITDAERAEQRRILRIEPDVPLIVYAGRVDHTKGMWTLVDSLRYMEQRAHLVVCGSSADTQLVESLQQASTGFGISWLDRRLDVRSLLAAADLVVLPSLVQETQGMVAIEAMSCGTPVVASAVGGIPETLSAFTDHLVPPGDEVALAGALDRLIGWRQHSPALGHDARRWVVEHRTLDRTVDAVSSLLGDLGRRSRLRKRRARVSPANTTIGSP